MKIRLIFFLFILNTLIGYGQQSLADSRAIINLNKQDTTEVNTLIYLANQQSQFDSAIYYIQKGLTLAQKIKYKRGEADCFIVRGSKLYTKDISATIHDALRALNIYKELNDNIGIVTAHGVLQGSYRDIGDYKNALSHAFEGVQVAKSKNVKEGKFFFEHRNIIAAFFAEISQTYLLLNKLDSAKVYAEKAIIEKEISYGAEWNFPYYLLATIQSMQGNYKIALEDYHAALHLAIQNGLFRDTLQIFSGMSTTFKNKRQLDSSIYYASQVVESQNPEREIKTFLEALNNLALVYKLKGDKDSALKYIEWNYAYKDSILSLDKERKIQNITFNEKLKQQEIIAQQAKFKSRIHLYALVAGLSVLLLITGILWRNNLNKNKANQKINHAFNQLKSTQSQLIQSEKMASLGELTAGIAHEIQNPLNFVNNFSEVNTELIDELKAELATGNMQLAIELANDIKDNEQKIYHHGKRAGDIVKGMLQHSRSSSGVKEPTDINALCDEYLRLSYHGLRAKDPRDSANKSFNATMKTDFDNSIGSINIIPQDIGRVVLNLINNAFYAVDEKKKKLHHRQPAEGIEPFEPIVTITTKRLGSPLGDGGKVEIRVTDNGNGIPPKVLDKIFQPFFTTKPTGQGTGLGLSLSYDIVKAHGGELKVETKEGEFAEFIIILKINSI